MQIESKNIFFVSNFNVIGGVETFIFELARKYRNYDITVIYKTGDINQINRLKKYVRVIKFNNQKFKCEKAFFNYETSIIDSIEAKEYIQIIHAMFKTQVNLTPRIHPKITKYLCVSEKAGQEWEELTGFKPILCRNPLTIAEEEKQPILYLISATRLTIEKGKNRMIKLAQKLDEAGVKYLWLIFTNDTKAIDNPNIIYMPPRLDIRPFIAGIKDKGYGVQLSDCEGDCYFTRECEGLGVPLIVTPIPSFKEQGLINGKNCYYVPFDMKDIPIEDIINKIPKYESYVRGDIWNEILEPGESTYQEELNTLYKVEALETYQEHNTKDVELGFVPEPGYRWMVNKERFEILTGDNPLKKIYVKFIKTLKKEDISK